MDVDRCAFDPYIAAAAARATARLHDGRRVVVLGVTKCHSTARVTFLATGRRARVRFGDIDWSGVIASVLGLDDQTDWTVDDVEAAFRRAAKAVHPDVGGTDADFKRLAEARALVVGALKDRGR